MDICKNSNTDFDIEEVLRKRDPEKLTQFLLDPTSMNLTKRVHINDPVNPELYRVSRDLCSHIHKERLKLLGELAKKT